VGRFQTKVRELRENQLLSIAEGMIASAGCEHFSTEQLAQAMGVGKGTVYSHHASQRALLGAVLDRVSERLLLMLQSQSNDDAFGQLTLTATQIVDEIIAAPKESLHYPCCLRSSPCPYDGGRMVDQVLVILIERGAQAGAVRQDIDAGLAARFFQHLLSAAVNGHVNRDERHRNLRAAVQFYLSGLVPRSLTPS
jgi:AcrR family transcriptional regulator